MIRFICRKTHIEIHPKGKLVKIFASIRKMVGLRVRAQLEAHAEL